MLFWKSCIEAAEFSLEANGVITMRLLKIARGGSDGAQECWRMMAEKIAALPTLTRLMSHDTAQAMTWVMLEPGWIVHDVLSGNAIEVRYEGARIH